MSYNNQIQFGSSSQDDQFMNIDELEKNVIAQNKSAKSQIQVAEPGQINSFQKETQNKGGKKTTGVPSAQNNSSESGNKAKDTVQA